MYMMEGIQKHREFTMSHGGLLESEDLLGRRMGNVYELIRSQQLFNVLIELIIWFRSRECI